MEAHHEAWLKRHTRRTREWLRDRLRDGFDVHHLDGNHANNNPDNLILIDHRDHMMIHGSPNADRTRQAVNLKARLKEKRQREKDKVIERGEIAYAYRQCGYRWRDVAVLAGFPYKASMEASEAARLYAKKHDKEWPLPDRSPRITQFAHWN